MNKFFLSCLLSLSGTYLMAQSNTGATPSLQKIIPVTPEASALAKYINYEVNYCNGLPQIEIPIYAVKDGDITIPISLGYHASGMRVSETPGWVGMGWSLSAEPFITRSIKGKADEDAYLYGVSPATKNSPFYLPELAKGNYDEQPDEYYYKLFNKSGKFYFQKEYGQPWQIIPEPYNHVRITTDTLRSFQINDGNGLLYSFGGNNYVEQPDGANYWRNGWKASEVTSLKTGSKVTFNYHNRDYYYGVWNYVDYISIIDSLTWEDGIWGMGRLAERGWGIKEYMENQQVPMDLYKPLPIVIYGINGQQTFYKASLQTANYGQLTKVLAYTGNYQNGTNYTVRPLLIREINFRNGKVIFYRSNNGRNILDSIRIVQNNQLFKTFRFYHSFYLTTEPTHERLRLDSLAIADASGNAIEKYRFNYYGDYLPDYFSKAVDYWGFYNGAQNRYDSVLVPSLGNISCRVADVPPHPVGAPMTINVTNTTNREPNEAFMQFGILSSITYPTGGTAEFVYEMNRYHDPTDLSIRMAGGLRIKQIKNFDPVSNKRIVRTFKYGNNENGAGYIKIPMTKELFFTESQDLYINLWGTNDRYALRRRTYSCNSMLDMFFSSGSPVSYPYVTEYTEDPDNVANTSGKTIYTYGVSFIANTMGYKVPGTPIVYGFEKSWEANQLRSKEQFKLTNTGYKLVQKSRYGYGSKIVPGKSITVGQAYGRRSVVCPVNPNDCYDFDASMYSAYTVNTGDTRLHWQKDTLFFDDGSQVVTEKTYEYDDSLNLVKETMPDSRGNNLVTLYKYPYNTAPVLSNHIGNNLVSTIVEKVTSRNGQQVESLKNNFFTENTSPATEQLLPVSIYHTTGMGSPEKRIVFNKYGPYGNVAEQFKANDVLYSYIWDYKQAYPIAEAEGADSASIAYTSFEADGAGNWIFGNNEWVTGDGITGNRCYRLANYSIVKTGLSSTKTYIVSYWTKNTSAFTIGGTQGTAFKGKTIKGWTYYEHTITGVSQVTIPQTIALIDELRLYPAGTKMTTYTYTPLIGMAGSCSPDNLITYYEYDGLQRLKLIRDQDGNIIKTIEYHYKQQ